MKQLLFVFLGLTLFNTAMAMDSNSDIICESDRMGHTLEIHNDHVLFINVGEIKLGRELASKGSVRTKSFGNGFDKFTYFDGHKYTIHIEDKDNLNEVNDYVLIKSPKGHEITYMLSCRSSK